MNDKFTYIVSVSIKFDGYVPLNLKGLVRFKDNDMRKNKKYLSDRVKDKLVQYAIDQGLPKHIAMNPKIVVNSISEIEIRIDFSIED